MPTRTRPLVKRSMSKAGSLEPSNIFSELKMCPPLMREQAKVAYVGKEVVWLVIFMDGYEQSSGQVRLTFQPDPDQLKLISGTVRLSDYPWLKSTPAGEAIHVRGRIKKIDTLSIELELSDLLLAQPIDRK